VLETIEETPEGVQVAVDVLNEQGLHARPAARLAQEAQRFAARMSLVVDEAEVDAKSILDILSLAAAKGTRIVVRASGDDAHAAVEHIAALFNNRFRE
jgi:phosphocarrier protein